MEQQEKITVKSLLPRGWTVTLVKRTRRSQPYISKVVNDEDTSAPIWPEIMKLAEEEQERKRKEEERLNILKSQSAKSSRKKSAA